MKTMVGCEIREHLRQHSTLEVRGQWFDLLLVRALSQLVALDLELFRRQLEEETAKALPENPSRLNTSN